MILLDTHVLLWLDADAPTLGNHSRELIETAWSSDAVAVSAISFWECALLSAQGRIILSKPVQHWREDLLMSGLMEHPLDGGTGILATELDGLHRDPADHFIAATAIRRDATLVTADERLLAWRHPLKRQDARL
jgi:PIN domain nuclease of toxin-antitoxin system